MALREHGAHDASAAPAGAAAAAGPSRHAKRFRRTGARIHAGAPMPTREEQLERQVQEWRVRCAHERAHRQRAEAEAARQRRISEQAERKRREAADKVAQVEHSLLLNNLGELLQDQGKLDEAAPYYEQALAIDKKVYGEEHPDVATGLNNLASLLYGQGKLDEAAPYVEQSLAIWKKVHGEEHPQVATGLNNLGQLLQDCSPVPPLGRAWGNNQC